MVRLATVTTGFHARVIAARLGADGILTELRGSLDGPYPMGDVHVYVTSQELAQASEILLIDELESAFEAPTDASGRRSGAGILQLLVVVACLVAIAVTAVARAA